MQLSRFALISLYCLLLRYGFHSRLYYVFCTKLVHYPTVSAPTSGSVTVTTQCADNAHVRSGSSLNVTCNSNGNWSGVTPVCQCNEGYHGININGTLKCEGRENS